MTEKLALRARLRAVRDAYVPAGPIRVPDAFVARLHPAQVVAAYVPIGSEADPAPLADAARNAGCTLALPHVTTRVAPLRFLLWDEAYPLETGAFGLRQPASDAPEIRPDIIVTPLLGFDGTGNRLGQGAGHYDRAFAAHPVAWRVGVAWSIQRVEALAPDPWDVPLHAIATESDWIVPMEITR